MVIKGTDLPIVRKKYGSQKVVLALGTYDLLHVGHLDFLTWCKGLGDILVVAVNNDSKVQHVKGAGRPIIPEKDRLRMVDALAVVDYSILALWHKGDTEACFIEFGHQLQPDIVCIGSEAKDVVPLWNESLPGASIIMDPQQKARSTTSIIEGIRTSYAKQ